MKRSTGIVFLIAVLLAAGVYFFERHHTEPSDNSAAASKPTFTISPDDIRSFRIERKGDTFVFEHRSDGWYITQPLASRGDQSVVSAVPSQLSTLETQRTFPAGSNNAASFGLDHPDVTLEFTLKNGAKHTLRLGTKDFSAASVYALIDDRKDVALLPETIFDICDKPLEDFRDRTLLSVPAGDAVSFVLHNKAGDTIEAKKDTDWNIVKPHPALADSAAVSTMLQAVATSQISRFVADSAADLAKYGLAQPSLRFSATLADGKSAELQFGKKDGNEYYARDTSRPTIFRVTDAVYTALNQTFASLRDKQLVHLLEGDISKVQIRSSNGLATCVRNANGELVEDQPAGAKTPAAACPNFLPALITARAQEIYDQPSPAVSAKLAKPFIDATLFGRSAQNLQIHFSAPSGDTVYARVGERPEVYKLDKGILTDLDFKPSGLSQAPSTTTAPTVPNSGPK